MVGEQLARATPGPAGVGYALLIAPSANRVYAAQAPHLTGTELAAFGETVLAADLHDLHPLRLGGVPYVGFRTDRPLGERDVAYLSNVSSAYALYARQPPDPGGGGPHEVLLRPVTLTPLARFDDDLITIPKYAGKTNEQFTQLLLNVTVLASARAGEMLQRRLVVLDPLCGRGTTLNQALRYGYDTIGIEIDGGHVDAYATFLRTWLRRKRLKHTVAVTPVRRERRRIARRLEATVAPSRQAHRDRDVQRVTVFHADTGHARDLLRPGCCDVIVTDAPYGVAHGSRTAGRPGGSRNPLDLLAGAVPGWAELLRRGGAIGIAWNTHLATREQVAAVLARAGLEVVVTPAYTGFAHHVDQAINRDVVVARKV
jgi:SAM-dependent methyltransferase